MNEMNVISAIQLAKKFLNKPLAWPKEERLTLLKKMAEVIHSKSNEWSHQEALAQGLSPEFVKENSFEHALFLIEKYLKELSESQDSKTLVNPTGVIAVITAWPLSFRLVMEAVVPALAAGNAVIVKVSSKSPVTAEILSEIAKLCEISEGALNVLLGEGAKVGAFLAAHPGIRAVSFVGKTKTAEQIIKSTATQFKKLQLRGSAKNAAVVLPGFDDSKISELLKSFLVGNAQTGWSMSRLITTEAEAPRVIEKLKMALKDLPKDNRLPDSQNLADLTRKAVQEHGKLMLESSDGPQFLIDLPNCSDLQQEELSAPLFPIVTVKYQHEIAKWLNNTSYGNLATIWGDPEKALKVAEKLEVGAVWINHWMRAQDESPWGLKQSAFGIPDRRAFGPFFSDRKLTS